jgi:hypothetical protein
MSLRLAPLATDWGRELHLVAQTRGINSVLHTPYTPPSPGRTVFARLPQRSPEEARAWALRHVRAGGKSVQSAEDLLCYENRGRQMDVLADFMPHGAKVRTMEAAEEAIDSLMSDGSAIVSKATFGSGSATVRLLKTKDEALAEAKRILHGGGQSFAGGWPVQHGECLWQRFLMGNDYSLRVTRITKQFGWAFKVMNRRGDWRASGSGVCVPLTPAEWALPYHRSAIATALRAADVMDSRWVGFDLLMDRTMDQWRVVDVTLAWNLRGGLIGASYDAPVYDLHAYVPHPRGLRGASQWNILLDDLLEATCV